jgi:hypothetical protein
VASHLNVSKVDLDFTYSACSGAVVKEITQQAEKLSSDQQFIMLSAVCSVGVTLCPLADFDLRAATTPT